VPDTDHPTLVIVPTYNERDNLPGIVKALGKLSVDLLVVDDNSPDGTGDIADELSEKHRFVNVLHRKKKNGLGRAYCAGFEWALQRDYEFVFEMDGDFSHDPNDIPRFLKMTTEADLVLGTRYRGGIRVNNWPLRRLILSLGAAKYVKWITGMPFSDPTGGYKCFRRHALESVDLAAVRSNGYSFQIEMTHKIWRQGLRVAEQNIVFTERIEGTSKMSWHIAWEAVWMVWRLWFQHRLRRWPKK
jgi:dolichol-phosphate mannosyltransferase